MRPASPISTTAITAADGRDAAMAITKVPVTATAQMSVMVIRSMVVGIWLRHPKGRRFGSTAPSPARRSMLTMRFGGFVAGVTCSSLGSLMTWSSA